MDPSIRSAVMHLEKTLEDIVGNGNVWDPKNFQHKVEQRIILCQRELPRWHRAASDQRSAWRELEEGLRELKRRLSGIESTGKMLNAFKCKVVIPFLEETIGDENRSFVKQLLGRIKQEQEKFPADFFVMR